MRTVRPTQVLHLELGSLVRPTLGINRTATLPVMPEPVGRRKLGESMYIEAIEYAFGLLKDVLGPLLSKRFERKSSTEIALGRSLDLYRSLCKVRDLSGKLIGRLESLLAGHRIDDDGLGRDANALSLVLLDLKEVLRSLNPQLEIHQNELVGNLVLAGDGREDVLDSGVFGDVVVRVGSPPRDPEDEGYDLAYVEEVLNRMNANQTLLNKVIAEYRAFLASEFPFKESFYS